MNPVEFFTRLIIGLAAFVFLVLIWAVAPYAAGAHTGAVEFPVPVASIFFGTAKPKMITVLCLLLARGGLGMAISSWILVPALQFFVDADFRYLARAGVIIFMSISVIAFLSALLAHIVYYGGA